MFGRYNLPRKVALRDFAVAPKRQMNPESLILRSMGFLVIFATGIGWVPDFLVMRCRDYDPPQLNHTAFKASLINFIKDKENFGGEEIGSILRNLSLLGRSGGILRYWLGVAPPRFVRTPDPKHVGVAPPRFVRTPDPKHVMSSW